MAKRRARARRMVNRRTMMRRQAVSEGLNASVVPRVLLGAVDGVGVVAVGALQIARDVLLSAVSGAANIGAEALTATVTGTRGVVSAASQTVADIAGAAQGTFLATIDNVRHSRRGPARLAPRRPVASMAGESDEKVASVPSPARARRRAGRPRLVTRPARPSVAA
jgi:hypothetical protein